MTSSSRSIVSQVVAGQLCVGCGLCASLAPQALVLEEVPPGYLRPRARGDIPVPPDAERDIAQSCPGNKVQGWPDDADPLWGPAKAWLTGRALDPEVGYKGSSGGVISGLAIYLMEKAGLDGVLQIAASHSDPTRNTARISRSRADILEAAGSRYAPSATLAGMADILAGKEERLVFIGKPCDVSAMRRLALVDPRVDERFPVMLSFFCAGVPSQNGTLRMLETMGLSDTPLTSFRYRGDGWPGFARATAEDGRSAELSYADSWGNILSKEVQFRCKLCPDGIGGTADIACADAWHGDERGYPDFSEGEGRSLVIPRTEKGAALVKAAVEAGVITTSVLNKAEIAQMQPSQARRRRELLARNASLVVLGRHRVDMKNLHLTHAARQIGWRQHLRTFASTLRRVLNRRF